MPKSEPPCAPFGFVTVREAMARTGLTKIQISHRQRSNKVIYQRKGGYVFIAEFSVREMMPVIEGPKDRMAEFEEFQRQLMKERAR